MDSLQSAVARLEACTARLEGLQVPGSHRTSTIRPPSSGILTDCLCRLVGGNQRPHLQLSPRQPITADLAVKQASSPQHQQQLLQPTVVQMMLQQQC